MEKLVSVIIPIYNTEKYLRKCLESVVNQTYKNIEIICVIDGSPDKSITICQEYKSKDPRIKIINKINGGLSSARNEGLKNCNGSYITFLDSDDYLEYNAIEHMVITIINYNIDIVCIDKYDVDENYNVLYESNNKKSINILNTDDFLKGLCDRSINCAVWGKLFKKELFDNLIFNESRLNEDFLLLSEMLIAKKKKIIIDSYKGYYYLERSNSISRGGFGKSSRDAVLNTIEMLEKVKKECSSLIPYYGAYAAYQARTALIIMNKTQYANEVEFIKLCKKTILNNKKYFKNSVMSFKDKMFCRVYMIFPNIALLIAHLMNRR